jgi:hypothetical protein
MVAVIALTMLGFYLRMEGELKQTRVNGSILALTSGMAVLALIGDQVGFTRFFWSTSAHIEIEEHVIRFSARALRRELRLADLVRIEVECHRGVCHLQVSTLSEGQITIPQDAWQDLRIEDRIRRIPDASWETVRKAVAAGRNQRAVVWSGQPGGATALGNTPVH